jgi:hypothetical protein
MNHLFCDGLDRMETNDQTRAVVVCGRSGQFSVVTRRPMAKSRVSQTTVFVAQRRMLRTLHD